jgi:hypothetical protein
MSVTNGHNNNGLKPDICTFTVSVAVTHRTHAAATKATWLMLSKDNQSSFLNLTQHRSTLYEQMLKQVVCEV